MTDRLVLFHGGIVDNAWCMVYGDTGCYPISIHITVRMIVYWLKLCSSDERKIYKKLYNVLLHMHDVDIYHSEWLNSIINILHQMV